MKRLRNARIERQVKDARLGLLLHAVRNKVHPGDVQSELTKWHGHNYTRAMLKRDLAMLYKQTRATQKRVEMDLAHIETMTVILEAT